MHGLKFIKRLKKYKIKYLINSTNKTTYFNKKR